MQALHDQLTVGGGDAYESAEELCTGLDYYLLRARDELLAEIDGAVVNELANNAAEDEARAEARAKRIDRWQAGDIRDESSKNALSQWEALLTEAAEQGWFRSLDYKASANHFLVSGGALPRAREFTTAP